MKLIIMILFCSFVTLSCKANDEHNLYSKEVHKEDVTNQYSALKITDNSLCNPGIGWEHILKYNPEGFYFFGEMHGTNDIAPLVVEFACIAAETAQKPTLVLFEVDSFSHVAFSEVYKLPKEERRKFLFDQLSHFWLLDTQDGRRTEVIMQAMLRVIELNDFGIPIYIGSVGATHEQYLQLKNPEVNKSIYTYEFENMLKYHDDFSNIITLTGNWHAFRYAHKMNELNRNDWLAFDQVFLSGEGLNCMDECKINPLGVHRLADTLGAHKDESYVILTGAHKLFNGYVLTKHTTAAQDLPERLQHLSVE